MTMDLRFSKWLTIFDIAPKKREYKGLIEGPKKRALKAPGKKGAAER